MAGYQNLGRITDPAIYSVCKQLFDLNAQLLRRLETLEGEALRQGQSAQPFNAGGTRISDLGRPTLASDAVTVQFMREYVTAQLALAIPAGATGTIDTTATQTITVENGIVTKIA